VRSSYLAFLQVICQYGSLFWDITPCNLKSIDVSEEHVAELLASYMLLVFCLAYSSILMMETCSSETSVDTQRTIWRYIPEDRTLHNHSCENIKSYNIPVNKTDKTYMSSHILSLVLIETFPALKPFHYLPLPRASGQVVSR
jgi:hypothetical protein